MKKRTLVALPLMIGSLLLALLPLGAQGQDANRAGAIADLEAGQRVRVRAADALSMEGVFLGLEGPDIGEWPLRAKGVAV